MFRPLLATCLAALALAGCGQAPRISEAPATTPLAAANIAIRQTGRAAVTIDVSSVRFALDAAGTLVISANITSRLASPQTIIIRATIYDATDTPISDATGGNVNVPPGSTTPIRLSGPQPHGTITAATFEITAAASPT
ncbi:MAG: hypothetical protein ACR2GX_01565 [Candidatus Dormibacteria bacterium]